MSLITEAQLRGWKFGQIRNGGSRYMIMIMTINGNKLPLMPEMGINNK